MVKYEREKELIPLGETLDNTESVQNEYQRKGLSRKYRFHFAVCSSEIYPFLTHYILQNPSCKYSK